MRPASSLMSGCIPYTELSTSLPKRLSGVEVEARLCLSVAALCPLTSC